MKRIFNIIKAFWFMNTSAYTWLLPVILIFSSLISIVLCIESTAMVLDYVNRGTPILFSNIVVQILNLINISYVFIFSTQGITRLKGKVTGNLNNFLIQMPILKKDIYHSRFIIFKIASIPFFIVVIYFIGLNIFVSTGELLSAYSGFIVLIYCVWNIILSISIGFSSLSSKKYKALRYLFSVLMLALLVFLIYLFFIPRVQPDTLVNNENMFSGLGPVFIPVLKTCRHIGGVPGLIIILVSSLISYFLGCSLPLRISDKEGA